MSDEQAHEGDSSWQLTWSELAAARRASAEQNDTHDSSSDLSDLFDPCNDETESPGVQWQGVGVVPSS